MGALLGVCTRGHFVVTCRMSKGRFFMCNHASVNQLPTGGNHPHTDETWLCNYRYCSYILHFMPTSEIAAPPFTLAINLACQVACLTGICLYLHNLHFIEPGQVSIFKGDVFRIQSYRGPLCLRRMGRNVSNYMNACQNG